MERTNWLGLFAFQGMQPLDATPKIENATFTETLNVSLSGTVRSGVIGDFKVTSVEAERL